MGNERKLVFLTSDWHCFHENSLKFDKRPFDNLDHMHRVLINNFNSTVPEDSITYFLGDMGLCTGDKLKGIIDQLHGTKVLIMGNHDKGSSAMYKAGFDVVLNSASLWIAGHEVTMSHCPLMGVWREDTSEMKGAQLGACWHGDHKNHAYSVPDRGQFHCHGHVHSPNSGKSQKILGKQRDVGVVGNNYRPVSISEIESWIAKYGR
jgi:calcineurin-like phosphoesterase family protein